MFCTYCGNNISDKAKFCQYCGKKTIIAAKDRMTEEPVPNYPGAEYTIIYSSDGQGENRIQKLSGGGDKQPDERTAQSAFGPETGDLGGEGFYESTTRPAFGPETGDLGGEGFYDSATRPVFGEDAGRGNAGTQGAGPSPSAEYTSKVFNSPVLGVAGLKADTTETEHSEEEEDDGKGRGILIALIVILILLILLVGFSAFAYIQGLIDF